MVSVVGQQEETCLDMNVGKEEEEKKEEKDSRQEPPGAGNKKADKEVLVWKLPRVDSGIELSELYGILATTYIWKMI